jgi:hypothetical protein
MSRTNPFKKKPRTAKRTLLVYGEGLEDEIFLKYLKGKYHLRDRGIAITIRNGKGGTPSAVVVSANNDPGIYDRRIVIIDNDKGKLEMNSARSLATSKRIQLIEITPCLEAVFLSIVQPGKSYSGWDSAACKKEFESKFIERKKRTDPNEYEKVFPKGTLDKVRTNVTELHILIQIME